MKPPKFEHIFVAVITFSPFLLCNTFDTNTGNLRGQTANFRGPASSQHYISEGGVYRGKK